MSVEPNADTYALDGEFEGGVEGRPILGGRARASLPDR